MLAYVHLNRLQISKQIAFDKLEELRFSLILISTLTIGNAMQGERSLMDSTSLFVRRLGQER
jgi:hypothetical protein